MIKGIFLTSIALLSIILLIGNTNSFSVKDQDGILYFRQLDNGGWIIVSGFGMRRKVEDEVRDTLLSMYQRNDTLTRMINMETSKGKIYGCYEYLKNPNQIFLSFCAKEYHFFNNGEVLKITTSPYCECE